MTGTTFPTLQVVPEMAEKSEDSATWLHSINAELIEAFAEMRRMRRIEQLLDIANTLTALADAARIDWGDASRLIGQPRDPARIPVLLKELELKLTALVALGGPEIAQLNELIGMADSHMSIEGAVFPAMDEIRSALAAA